MYSIALQPLFFEIARLGPKACTDKRAPPRRGKENRESEREGKKRIENATCLSGHIYSMCAFGQHIMIECSVAAAVGRDGDCVQ